MENVKTQNIASIISVIDNAIANDNKTSNMRLTLVNLINDALVKKFVSLEYKKNDKDNAIPLNKLNKIENVHIRFFVQLFQNYLGVSWSNKDSEQKAKIESLKDSLVAVIPLSLENAIVKDKKGNSFTGANNSKMFLNGDYVSNYMESLNKDNLDMVALNFSQLMKVSRAYYKDKNLGGSSKTKDNTLDSMIKKTTQKILSDLENDCSLNTQFTRDNLVKLTTASNQYISHLKFLQDEQKTTVRKINESTNKIAVNK